MTNSVTIELEGDELKRARLAAEAEGVAVEAYARSLIVTNLPSLKEICLSRIIGMASTGEPTDIARDKDKLIGEAVWQEYLEETRQK